MPPILGNIIALALVALLVYICARNLWGPHRAGGCTGSCSSCSRGCSCGGSCGKKPEHVSREQVQEMQTYFDSLRS